MSEREIFLNPAKRCRPYIKQSMTRYSLGRPVEEYELGNVALFLASNESSGITGQTIISHCGQHL
jgi:enoyl-[acyl-carrier-protein] reductase (NADH)